VVSTVPSLAGEALGVESSVRGAGSEAALARDSAAYGTPGNAVGFYDCPPARIRASGDEYHAAAGVSSARSLRDHRPSLRVAPYGPQGASSLTHEGYLVGDQRPHPPVRRPESTTEREQHSYGGFSSTAERAGIHDRHMIKRTQNVGGNDSVSLGEFHSAYSTSIQEAQRRVALDPELADLTSHLVAAGGRVAARVPQPDPSRPVGGRLTFHLDDGSGAHPSKVGISVAEAHLRASLLPSARQQADASQVAGRFPVKRTAQSPRQSRPPIGGETHFRVADLAAAEAGFDLDTSGRPPTSSSYGDLTASKMRTDKRLGGRSADLLDEVSSPQAGPRSRLAMHKQQLGGRGAARAGIDLTQESHRSVPRPQSARPPPGGFASFALA